MNQIFISYARVDRETIVEDFVKDLANRGIPTWYDSHIASGENWRRTVDNMISSCVGMIVVLTDNSLKSHNVTYEWTRAKALGKDLVMLKFHEMTETSHPVFDHQCTDFWNPTEDNWARLLERLEQIIDKENVHPSIKMAEDILFYPDPERWPGAVNTLETSRLAGATEALVRHTNSVYPEVCVMIGHALARRTNYQDPRAIIGLEQALQVFSENQLPQEQKQAIDAISQIVGDEAVDALVKILESTQNPRVINAILNQLSIRYDRDLTTLYLSYLTEEYSDNVRGAAIAALGRSKNRAVIPIVIQQMKTEASVRNRCIAASALGNLKGTEASVALAQRLVEHEPLLNESEARSIVAALGNIGDENALNALKEFEVFMTEQGHRYAKHAAGIRNTLAKAIEKCHAE